MLRVIDALKEPFICYAVICVWQTNKESAFIRAQISLTFHLLRRLLHLCKAKAFELRLYFEAINCHYYLPRTFVLIMHFLSLALSSIGLLARCVVPCTKG